MADKNDAIEAELILNPELGDMGSVERELSKRLSKAAKPLLDTLTDTHIGLNKASVRKAHQEIADLGRQLSDSMSKTLDSLFDKQGKAVLRSPKALKLAAKEDKDLEQLVNVLGGYSEASKILASPDARRRLESMAQAFTSLNDAAFQVSKLPAVDSRTQKLLTKLYKSNSSDSFRKLSDAQQRQVKDALAVIELQDKAFGNLKNVLAKAGMGNAAAQMSKVMRQRADTAKRLERVTSPQSVATSAKQERAAIERQIKLDKAAAKSRALSLEKDRVLSRTGGIPNLTSKQDIDAVKKGLNRDYNVAVQQLAIDEIGPGGKKGSQFKATEAEVARIQSLRAELKALEVERQRIEKFRAEADKRQIAAMADHLKMSEKISKEEQARRNKYEQDMIKQGHKQIEMQDRWLKEQAAQQEKDSQLQTKRARNLRQAQAIMKSTGGDFTDLDKAQVRTVRPYLQDRFTARQNFAETMGTKHGTDSPEFARAAQSAQEYARALGALDEQARRLRPSLGDLGQITRSFFRYALGYGALYQMLGGVVALGRGLVDLDEQLYNIQAITLSTDTQMRSVEGAIKQVGLTTKFTLNEVAKGAQILAQAGTAPEKIPQQLQAVADFAAATGSSLEQSADLLTSFTNVYKDIADGKAADLLTKTLNLSKLQGEDLRTIISYTAQTAEGYNISAENLMGAVATLRNVGIKPSTIATGLRQAMLEVFNPDKKLTEALARRYEQLGEKVTNEQISARFDSFTQTENPLLSAVSELKRLGFGGEASNLFSRAFDVRAFNPLKALTNNFDQFSMLSSQVGVGQSAAEASEIQLKSLRATVENLGASVVAFSDSVGGDMVRSLQSGAQAAADLIQKLTELDQKMKAETGQGLASSVSAGLLGGAAGAMLGGRGFLNKVSGAALGATAAGGFTAAKDTDGDAGSYVIPTLAALLAVVPSLADFIGGFRGRASEFKAAATKLQGATKLDVASTLGPALGAGAALADMANGLKGSGLNKFAGLGAGALLRVGAGLFVRAIPVIGLIYSAYELLQLFTGAESQLDEAISRARNQAEGAGSQRRKFETDFQRDQARVNEFRLDAPGGPKEGTTAAQIVNLQHQFENVELALQESFKTNIAGLGQAENIIRNYINRSSDQRQQDLEQLQQLGVNLEDRQAFNISSQLQELNKGVEGMRQSLLGELTRSTEELVKAGTDQNSEALQRATQVQRVLSELPALRDTLYGRATLPLEELLGLYEQFGTRMAEEAKKGALQASDGINLTVTDVIKQLNAVAHATQNSDQIKDSAQQLITTLEGTQTDVVAVLDTLAVKAEEEAGKLAAQADALKKRADLMQKLSTQPSFGQFGGIGGQAYPDAAGKAESLMREASLTSRAAEAQRTSAALAREGSARAANQDLLSKGDAEKIAAANQQGVAKALSEGLFTDEFMENLTGRLADLARKVQDPIQRSEMQAQLSPVQVRTGQYTQSPVSQQLGQLLEANQRFRAAQDMQTKQQKAEDAKKSMMSDPDAQVRLADLQNQLKASDRRRDFENSKKIAEEMAEIQTREQAKAVKRAEVDLKKVQDDVGKDDTNARERVSSEVAKLRTLEADLQATIRSYADKEAELDLKRRTVEVNERKDIAESSFGEAIDRGDLEKAKVASKEYAAAQTEALELAKKELALRGFSADEIELEIRTRKGATIALIDQEQAQKRLTDAIIARTEFETRTAGTGPSTGNRATDAFIQESGVGFTNMQVEGSLVRDIEQYTLRIQKLQTAQQAQLASMIRGTDEFSAVEEKYTRAIEETQYQIGATAAQLQQLRNGPWAEIKEGFDLTALTVGLEQSTAALANLGETIRGTLVTGLDEMGTVFGEAIYNSGELARMLGYTRDEAYSGKDAILDLISTMAEQTFMDTSKSLFNSAAKGGINLLGKGFNALTGGEGDVASGEGAKGKAGSAIGKIFSGIFGGTDEATATGVMEVSAQTVNVNSSGMGGLGGGEEDKLGQQLSEKVGGPLSAGFDMLKGGFGKLTSTLGGLASTLWAGFMQMITAIFTTSATETAAGVFASGGMPSRVIKGPKSAKRDNLAGYAQVAGRKVPIKVEADEGILNRNAMELIGGEEGLNAMNSGILPAAKLKSAPAMPATTSGMESLTSTIQENPVTVKTGDTTVVNAYSDQAIRDYVASRAGTRVIINELRKEGVI